CSNFNPAVPASFTLAKGGSFGDTATFTCSHVLAANDPNPYVNVACFDAQDAIGGAAGTFADTCGSDTTKIVHPGFQVTKSADKASAHVGDTVTYTITATNTGDDALTVTNFNDHIQNSATVGCSNFSPAVPAS